MHKIVLFTATILLSSLSASAQAKRITLKVIDEFELSPIPSISVQTTDTTLQSYYDVQGLFTVPVHATTKSLTISCVGFEPAAINVADSCEQFEIILLSSSSYDFRSLKKVNRLRWKQFQKLPTLRDTAYRKGVFQSKSACYTQRFISDFPGRKYKKTTFN